MTHKSCITCAYNAYGEKFLGEIYPDTIWRGYIAECQRQIWTVGYQISPGTNILKDAHNHVPDKCGNVKDIKKSIDELKQIFPEDFDLTKVPLSDGKWHDLAKYKCRHYYPERKRGTMSREKCWEEHQQRKERVRFVVTTSLSIIVTVAVVLTAIFHLIELLGVES